MTARPLPPLRDYQHAALLDALQWVAATEPPARRLYCAPTGTGKGSLLLALRSALAAGGASSLILSPSLEVLRGLLDRSGLDAPLTDDALAAAALEGVGATTPTRLRNRILAGEATMPDVLLYDEAHHATDTNEVSGLLAAVHGDDALWIGCTATPYRGTPRGTVELRQQWGTPVPILTLDQAVRSRWCSLPRTRVVPLLDDDEVRVVNGEFKASGAGGAGGLFATRVDALAALLRDLPRRPTIVAVPSTESAGALVEACDRIGVDATAILQHTTQPARVEALDRCRRMLTILVQIRVVSEGVDLPWLRRIVDARPVVSPVAWVQLLGRAMRPHGAEEPPEYWCVCRNLERHAYLLGGVLPREAVAEAQAAFGGPSKRTGARGIGFEALGRFKAVELPLANGLTGHMYTLHCPSEVGAHELVVLVHPCKEEPLIASREVAVFPTPDDGSPPPRGSWRGRDGRDRRAGPWQRLDLAACADLTGYATKQSHDAFSDKQRASWERDAARLGLDPAAAPRLKRRQFAALPVLRALGGAW